MSASRSFHWLQPNDPHGTSQPIGRAGRAHDLQHFAVPLWVAQGIPIVAMSRYVAHANPTITFGTYAHVFEEDAHREKIAAATSWPRPVPEAAAASG